MPDPTKELAAFFSRRRQSEKSRDAAVRAANERHEDRMYNARGLLTRGALAMLEAYEAAQEAASQAEMQKVCAMSTAGTDLSDSKCFSYILVPGPAENIL